jgi:C-terminal processing protease CtpA/Prc
VQTAKEELEWEQQRDREKEEKTQDKLKIEALQQDLRAKDDELQKTRLAMTLPRVAETRSLSASSTDQKRQAGETRMNEEAEDAEQFSNRCTIGLMLSGAQVDNLVVGGPAYNTALQRGDEIVLIDGMRVGVEDMPAAIIGADLPGSTVVLTVKRLGAAAHLPQQFDVVVIRVESRELADKRRLFELFTAIENLIGTS